MTGKPVNIDNRLGKIICKTGRVTDKPDKMPEKSKTVKQANIQHGFRTGFKTAGKKHL